MNKSRLFFVAAICFATSFVGCSDLLEPLPEKRLTQANLEFDPRFAEGLLLRAYKGLETEYNFEEDVASDDAVSNDPSSKFSQITDGSWASDTNPLDRWGKTYEMFLYLNKFIEIAPNVQTWDILSSVRNANIAKKLVGEAHALRAFYGFRLLQAHAGMSGSELLGYPIITKVLDINDFYKLPRNTYKDCVDQVLSDLDIAINSLPLNWTDINGNADYNNTLGARNLNRINGLTAKMIKSRVLLYAASPSFAESGVTWLQAASAAAEVINDRGGLATLRPADNSFFVPTGNQNLPNVELIWYSNFDRVFNNGNEQGAKLEKQNFPPSQFGLGRTNPTQDLVDSFPNADGTPFNKAGVTSKTQYVGRDPRLERAIIRHEGSAATGPRIVMTPGTIDAPGFSQNATVTGYYIKKFMNPGVKIDPKSPTVGAIHFYTYARFTEALLNFAEAANEAVGPDGLVGSSTFTARQVINAIRSRGGITNLTYVNSISDKDSFRMLIRNERRIELCFEGHRFWDIRRWNDKALMKMAVSGVKVSADNSSTVVSVVQNRGYQDHHIYGPIPFDETLKYPLKQNDGWQ